MFMGTVIGSAVCPLWNMMNWDKASGKGAIIAAWVGVGIAFIAWLSAAKIQGGVVTVDTLGKTDVMLIGNVTSIISSGVIHYFYSKYIDPQNFDFAELDARITLVEMDLRGLTDAERDPVELRRAERWVKKRGYILTFILIIAWPILSLPQKIFSQAYFAFWVLVSIGKLRTSCSALFTSCFVFSSLYPLAFSFLFSLGLWRCYHHHHASIDGERRRYQPRLVWYCELFARPRTDGFQTC